MKYKLLIISLLLIISAWFAYRYLGDNNQSDVNSIIVGTSPDYPPYSFLDENGTVVGYDIDVMREICARLDKVCIIKAMPFETLLPQLQLGAIHLVASGITETPERKERVYLSNPYISGSFVLLMRQENNIFPAKETISFNDLSGKSVIVNQGYTTDLEVRKYPEIHAIILPNISDALLALQHKRGDGFLTEVAVVPSLQKASGDKPLAMVKVDGGSQQLVFAISKKYPDLVDAVNGALNEMNHAGVLTELQAKWGLE